MLPCEPYKKTAVILMYAVTAAAVVYLFFGYLWGVLLPFIVAYIFSFCFAPIVNYGERHKGFPKRTAVLVLVLLSASVIILLLYAIIREICGELSNLVNNVSASIERVRSDDSYANEVIEKINSVIPFVDIRARLWEIRADLDHELGDILVSVADRVSGTVIPMLGKAVSFLPNALLVFAVIIISTYYFAIDRVRVNGFFMSLVPKSLHPKLRRVKQELGETVLLYVRAYSLIFLMTFAELLLAFVIIGVDYAFVLALITAIIDILPVVGTGTVLLPWSAVLLLTGSYGRGIALLATYAVITVVRQIAEPKIIGKFIGLSPLAALASMYIGLELMGVAGLFVFPLAAILLSRLIKNKSDGKSVA